MATEDIKNFLISFFYDFGAMNKNWIVLEKRCWEEYFAMFMLIAKEKNRRRTNFKRLHWYRGLCVVYI